MTTTCLSEVPLPESCVIVFDLDDTLCPERDFVLSGFRAVSGLLGKDISSQMVDWFDAGEKDALGRAQAETGTQIPKEDMLRVYREHRPNLELKPGVSELLEKLRRAGHPIGLITDGRSITQRNKIVALGIEQLLDEIVISEEFGSGKPDERNFRHFENKFPDRNLAYVGDNLAKDFVTPNKLGWTTICLLDAGSNIHVQDFDAVAPEYLPHFRIERLA